jgi:MinD-like ATPase involved in chromosome partitioning or flagellar assembly
MRLRLVTAGVGAPWESALVQACQDGSVPAAVVQRCYDLGDLLAAAAAGKAEVAMVAAGVRWLDRETLARVASAGLALLGLVPAGDEEAERRLLQLGVDYVIADSTRPPVLIDLAKAVLAARRRQEPRPGDGGLAGGKAPPHAGAALAPPHPAGSARAGTGVTSPRPAWRRPPASRAALSAAEAHPAEDLPDGGEREHSLVVVWGPKGAPGRTTVAVNLAFESFPLAGETLLVDADAYGGTIAQTLGFLDDCPGLAWAARLAARGELDGPRLWQATRRAGADGPSVLAGLPRADLWTEVRPSTWEALLELFRVTFPLTVIDVNSCLEEDEELLYDHVRFRRNAVSRLALQRADTVVAVAKADPVGLHDFVRGFQQLHELGVTSSRVRVVVNQVRGGLFGGDAIGQIQAALSRYLGLEPWAFIPYDRSSLDAALMAGQALREARPDAPARKALAALASSILGLPTADQQRRRLRRRRGGRRAPRWDGNASAPAMTRRGRW